NKELLAYRDKYGPLDGFKNIINNKISSTTSSTNTNSNSSSPPSITNNNNNNNNNGLTITIKDSHTKSAGLDHHNNNNIDIVSCLNELSEAAAKTGKLTKSKEITISPTNMDKSIVIQVAEKANNNNSNTDSTDSSTCPQSDSTSLSV